MAEVRNKENLGYGDSKDVKKINFNEYLLILFPNNLERERDVLGSCAAKNIRNDRLISL